MPEEYLQTPSLTDMNDYLNYTEGGVTRMTVSAEIPCMPEFIQAVHQRGVEVSLGHTGAIMKLVGNVLITEQLALLIPLMR